jgi:hypothetical protein
MRLILGIIFSGRYDMAYDDDGSMLRFREFEDLAILLERYLSAPEHLTITRVLALTHTIHTIADGRSPEKMQMQELSHGLRQKGLSNIPFDTVVRIAEIVGRISKDEDPLAHVTLRDMQRMISS